MSAKPLEWREPTDHPDDLEDSSILLADGIGGKYHISRDRVAGFLLWFADDNFIFIAFDSIEKAQECAERDWQFHYERSAA